jgi:hypothetical protein
MACILKNSQGNKIKQTKAFSLDTFPYGISTQGWIFSNNFYYFAYWKYWEYYLCTTWSSLQFQLTKLAHYQNLYVQRGVINKDVQGRIN